MAEERTKYFPKESLPFWDRLQCFSGMWEEVETGKYLPIAVSPDGVNLGTDGDLEEIARAEQKTKTYKIAGFPPATYIGSRETEKATYLFWEGKEGTYYMDDVGTMEVERWFREVQKKQKKTHH